MSACDNGELYCMSSKESWLLPQKIPLPKDFIGFDPAASLPRGRFHAYHRRLPHWRFDGACYFMTFRLNDSLPLTIVRQMRKEAAQWRLRLTRAEAAGGDGGGLLADVLGAWKEFQHARLVRLEALLDEGQGSCVLRKPACREVVAEALRYFEGSRCEMLAFVIMPNHVHVLCRPRGEQTLEMLAGAWKAATSGAINRLLGQTGRLWQQENFDRIIRDAEHYGRVMRYIAKNPVKARLRKSDATVWFCKCVAEANNWPHDA